MTTTKTICLTETRYPLTERSHAVSEIAVTMRTLPAGSSSLIPFPVKFSSSRDIYNFFTPIFDGVQDDHEVFYVGFIKGTMHFEFNDVKVWEQFNQRIAKIKGYPLFEATKKTDPKPEPAAPAPADFCPTLF